MTARPNLFCGALNKLSVFFLGFVACPSTKTEKLSTEHKKMIPGFRSGIYAGMILKMARKMLQYFPNQ